MKSRLAWAVAGAYAFFMSGMSAAPAQTPTPTHTPMNQAAPQLTPQQLDQLLAPIALYPDALLAQILMAATYPLEVVEGVRWLQDPHNASLKGDQLATALEQQNWDPSVKSIVPYPRILRMMDRELDWTERLGEAFLADQAAVIDTIQRLRRRAAAAGHLSSGPQAVVTMQEEAITIKSPSVGAVSFPTCNPSVVYGSWPYPAYPPDYFQVISREPAGGFGCGWIVAPIIAPLWGWGQWDWRRHRMISIKGHSCSSIATVRRLTATRGSTTRPIATTFPTEIHKRKNDLADARPRRMCKGALAVSRWVPLGKSVRPRARCRRH